MNFIEGDFDKTIMKDLSGTRHYMAPELKGQNLLVGREIDMWSFGILLYQMCVGYLPTQVKNYKYGTGTIPIRARDWKHLTNKGEVVQDLIMNCLEMDPE
jgi:serine/threonine protein kinase